MFRKVIAAAFASAAVLVCTELQQRFGSRRKDRRNAPPDPSWVGAISMHSNGAMSRHAPIRVLFMNDVIPAERVGTDASANVTISPAVKAQRHLRDAARNHRCGRRRQLRAGHGIPGLDQGGWAGRACPRGPSRSSSRSGLSRSNFEINAGALNVIHDKNELMILSGAIGTSDTEPREKLEKILTATLDGKPIAITWIGGDRNYRLRDPRHPAQARHRTDPHPALGRRTAGTRQQGREEHAGAGAG